MMNTGHYKTTTHCVDTEQHEAEEGQWRSVEGTPAIRGSTQTGDLLVLYGKLVVIRDLLSQRNVSLGVDHNLLLGTEIDHFCITVWLRKGER